MSGRFEASGLVTLITDFGNLITNIDSVGSIRFQASIVGFGGNTIRTLKTSSDVKPAGF